MIQLLCRGTETTRDKGRERTAAAPGLLSFLVTDGPLGRALPRWRPGALSYSFLTRKCACFFVWVFFQHRMYGTCTGGCSRIPEAPAGQDGGLLPQAQGGEVLGAKQACGDDADQPDLRRVPAQSGKYAKAPFGTLSTLCAWLFASTFRCARRHHR